MPEQLVYTSGGRSSGVGNIIPIAAGAATGDYFAILGASSQNNPLPDVYVDFESGTVRVVGAAQVGPVGARGYFERRPENRLLTQQQLLQQALTTGVVPPGLRGDYRMVGGQIAGRVVDTRVAQAQFGGGGVPISSLVGQSESGGGIPVSSWVNPAAMAFQTPAARALIQGAMSNGTRSGPRPARRRKATRTRVRRKRTSRARAAAPTRRRRRRGNQKLVKGSPAAKRFMARLRKMRGRRRSNG